LLLNPLMRLIDHPAILAHMTARGWRCLYPGGGAFAPPAVAPLHAVGWIGRPDPTIRPSALSLVRSIPQPYAPSLARLARQAWTDLFPGPAWIMPMSHWAYELRFGAGPWLAETLGELGIDPEPLAVLTTAAAIEFDSDEADRFEAFIEKLLQNLSESDFTIAWPDVPILCTVHHHQQLWWTRDQPELIQALQLHNHRSLATSAPIPYNP
jgi:hypothetical protein